MGAKKKTCRRVTIIIDILYIIFFLKHYTDEKEEIQIKDERDNVHIQNLNGSCTLFNYWNTINLFMTCLKGFLYN